MTEVELVRQFLIEIRTMVMESKHMAGGTDNNSPSWSHFMHIVSILSDQRVLVFKLSKLSLIDWGHVKCTAVRLYMQCIPCLLRSIPEPLYSVNIHEGPRTKSAILCQMKYKQCKKPTFFPQNWRPSSLVRLSYK